MLRRVAPFVLVCSIVGASPAAAQTSLAGGATAAVTKQGTPLCAVEDGYCLAGWLDGYGPAVYRYVWGNPVAEPAPDRTKICTRFADGLVVQVQAGTITFNLDATECRPGQSSAATGAGRSFGNPFSSDASWTVAGGTGAFEGETGAGTFSVRSAGARYVFSLAGTLD
jgi:hypothetical protein